jgi:two-component system, NarL family, response regulator LiaR
MIKVLIVDDHEILRMGLAFFFQSHEDIVVVGEAGDGQEAVELCKSLQPNVVLMDISMPGMDGITATKIILDENPNIAVIILTSNFMQAAQQEARNAGARDYLVKSVPANVITEAIYNAIQKP